MFSLYAVRYADKVALSVPGYKEVTERVVELTKKERCATVLGVGGDAGRIALKLAGSVFKVLVVDNSAETLERIRQRASKKRVDNIQTLKCSIADEAFLWPITNPVATECAFTSIICSFVLHRYSDSWKATILERLKKTLVVGGQMIIVDIDPAGARAIRRTADGVYRKLVIRRDGGLSTAVVIRTALSRLACRHFLSDRAWINILDRTGYYDAGSERIADFLIAYARSRDQE